MWYIDIHMVQEAIHEQIKVLEAQLEAKRKELESGADRPKENREMLREVLRDVAQEKVLLPAPPLSGTQQTDITDDARLAELKEKEHAHIVQELLNMAISKDVFAAIKMAAALKNPHIEDEFHDTLAIYFDKLIESRKIKT